jgi:hypothetical protein
VKGAVYAKPDGQAVYVQQVRGGSDRYQSGWWDSRLLWPGHGDEEIGVSDR